MRQPLPVEADLKAKMPDDMPVACDCLKMPPNVHRLRLLRVTL